MASAARSWDRRKQEEHGNGVAPTGLRSLSFLARNERKTPGLTGFVLEVGLAVAVAVDEPSELASRTVRVHHSISHPCHPGARTSLIHRQDMHFIGINSDSLVDIQAGKTPAHQQPPRRRWRVPQQMIHTLSFLPCWRLRPSRPFPSTTCTHHRRQVVIENGSRPPVGQGANMLSTSATLSLPRLKGTTGNRGRAGGGLQESILYNRDGSEKGRS